MAQEQFQVRGYMVLASVDYLRELAGSEGQRIVDAFAPQTREVVVGGKAGAWAPVSAMSEVTAAIATLAGGDQDRARDLLIGCGASMAREATNTFLRLLMKMLTPALFAKKVPDLWSRDCNRGKLIVDVTDTKLVCQVLGTSGFDHAACTATGFVTFALQTMGKSLERTTVTGWSLEKPSTDEAAFEIIWKS